MTFLKNKRGFTLIELMVVLAISSMIMAVVLFNYRGFVDQIALNGAAQEIALALREAQSYGLSVRGVLDSSGAYTFTSAYGVYFSRDYPNSIEIFVDKNRDGAFTDQDKTCVPSTAIGSECLSKIQLLNGVYISETYYDSAGTASVKGDKSSIQVLFKRPSTDAVVHVFKKDKKMFCCSFGNCSTIVDENPVCASPNTAYNSPKARIQITSPLGSSKFITIENSGQIIISNI